MTHTLAEITRALQTVESSEKYEKQSAHLLFFLINLQLKTRYKNKKADEDAIDDLLAAIQRGA